MDAAGCAGSAGGLYWGCDGGADSVAASEESAPTVCELPVPPAEADELSSAAGRGVDAAGAC